MNVYQNATDLKKDARALGPNNARAVAHQLGYEPDFDWSFQNYKAMIVAMAQAFKLRNHLEIGGGRDPLFSPTELSDLGIKVTVNDISQKELDLAPKEFTKLCGDIAALDTLDVMGKNRYDLAYSRMVMEHVPDVELMWENIHGMLAPGGIALSFFPTLFAPPFVINRLIPERLSRAILFKLFPHRVDEGKNPKFPAYYDYCRSSEATIVPMLERIGFREVTVLPFYGYSYFWKIPVLKQIDAVFTKLACKYDWRMFSSFAYIIAKK